MRIIIANYRYFIAGGPEKYMFKFMDAAEKSPERRNSVQQIFCKTAFKSDNVCGHEKIY